ncbi:hypothetical protein Slin15195_G025190 [Septoria linicola]|uniref:Uncharacterized protein n=1 Tax=Septoria linicola TaxID=215465 RepID=A0A9Q9EFQ4_9PEZI|nr:hypothetical protein Slin14017_G024280 [Septoria linicola]USW49200.1 hypothetical protein Slin15195_G025190 [Septoria linicola]
MDPSADGFSILGTAFTKAVAGNSKANGSLKRNTTQVSRRPIPGSFVDSPSDASATSDAQDDSRTTTPPKQLSRHDADFPPTPPTMTSSEVAESVPAERSLSPSPIFADRVRNELERHKSGLSTPVNLSNSPPTPDPSPPSDRAAENLNVPRPPLQQNYASSYAESFQTATEGLTPHASTTKVDLLPSPVNDTPRQSWIERGRALGLSNQVLAVQDEERVQNDQDSDIVTRVKNYHLESDDSEGEIENKTATYSASDERSTTDESTNLSSSLSKSLSQRQAVAVPRLRRPFQPGDEIKRPDDYLLYGSMGSVSKWKKPERMSKTPPAREMDSEFLRNAEPIFQPTAPEAPESGQDILQRLEDVIKEDDPEPTPLTALPPIPAEDRQMETPAEEEVKPLQEFTPTPAIKDAPSPPSSAQKEKSLEDNNVVYKMIQEENAKRHSAISDGSVQARVVAPVENKRKLRHTPKRDSLRGDVSMISSSDSHRLRHKRAMGSPGHGDAAVSPHESKEHNHARPSTAGAEIPAVQPFPRNHKASGDKRFSYSAIRDPSIKVAPAGALGNPHKLRRSLRHSSLDCTPRSVSDSARPLSMESSGFAALAEEAMPSPKLRRSSAEHRLDRNNDVRRTSLGQVPEVSPLETEPNPPVIAEEVSNETTKEELEPSPRLPMFERTPKRDRRESSEMSFKTTQSPRRKSLDYRSLHPTITPMSQVSGTAVSEAELCEAKGISLFPHNNKSLLVVQTARHVSIPDYMVDEDDSDIDGNPIPGIKRTNFKAFVTPAEEIGKPLYSVDSPLTNPRAAPEPPMIKFIPPTPNDELERQLGMAPSAEERHHNTENPRMQLQRSLSLKERIRRFSENLHQPVPFGRQNSYRRTSAPTRRSHSEQAEVSRPTHLSSFWQPRDFWEGYSDSDSDGDDNDYEPLPPGGDTSEVLEEERKRAGFLPRAMSKRMPGFRGSGGFLMGNSLGIDRHGSNSRRHYVDRRVNASHPSLRTQSTPTLRNRQSEEMLRRLTERQGRRIFKVPFSGGRRIEYVGLSAFSARLHAAKKRRQERQAEARRDQLRESIGTRVYHDVDGVAGRRLAREA